MANASILAAFERFWQHTVAALSKKADVNHLHSYLATKDVGEITLPRALWTSITYGNGKYVAISGTTNAAYSTDGIAWTTTTLPTLPTNASFSSIAYGNEKFVAVITGTTRGNEQTAAYSDNGIDWTMTTIPNGSIDARIGLQWGSVTYGNGKFIAAGIARNGIDYVAYSTDGITWTAVEGSSPDYITYANGRFIGVSDGVFGYSTDGIMWTNITLPSLSNSLSSWTRVAYGNGKYVVISTKGDVAYSTDGITWATSSLLPDSSGWSYIIYGNGKFVATRNVSSEVAYSTDGISWTIINMSNAVLSRPLTYGNGKFVAVSSVSSSFDVCPVVYSTDGINWYSNRYILEQDDTNVTDLVKMQVVTPQVEHSHPYLELKTVKASLPFHSQQPDKPSDFDYAYIDNHICYVITCTNNSDICLYSTDGVNWTTVNMPSASDWSMVKFGGDKFVAISSSDGKAAYSTDGINWIATSMPSAVEWDSVAYGNGKFLAICNSSDVAAYSTDGINWVAANMPYADDWTNIEYGNGKFVVAITGTNEALYSEDGVNWETTNMPYNADWSRIKYGNGRFVAICTSLSESQSYFAHSEDGINWEMGNKPYGYSWHDLTCKDGKFVAISGLNGKVAYSADGINWSSVCYLSDFYDTETTILPKIIAALDDKFMLINEVLIRDSGGISTYWDIFYSKNGTSWIKDYHTIEMDGVDVSDKVKFVVDVTDKVKLVTEIINNHTTSDNIEFATVFEVKTYLGI
jgi:hypothetical protein